MYLYEIKRSNLSYYITIYSNKTKIKTIKFSKEKYKCDIINIYDNIYEIHLVSKNNTLADADFYNIIHLIDLGHIDNFTEDYEVN